MADPIMPAASGSSVAIAAPGGSTASPTPQGTPAQQQAVAAAATAAAELAAKDGEKVVTGDIPDPLRADIHKLVEKARKEEKDKLYGQLEKAKTELAAKDTLIQTQADTLKKFSDGVGSKATKKADTEGSSGETPKGLTHDQLDLALAAGLKKAEESFSERFAALEAQNQKLTKELEQKEVGNYRNQLISENKDNIIEELVTGNTKEELELSLVVAKQTYARIAKTLSNKADASASSAESRIPPVPAAAAGGGSVDPNATKGQKVSAMSVSEYAKNRSQLLAEASKAAQEALKKSAE